MKQAPKKTRRGGRGPISRLTAWALRHAQVSLSTLGELTRNPLATLMTAAVIGVALALPAGLYQLLDNVSSLGEQWQGSMRFSLFLKPDVGDARAEALAGELRTHPGVEDVRLITRSQALEEFRQLSGFADALEALDENPLPAVLLIKPDREWSGPQTSQSLMEKLGAFPEIDVAQFDMEWTRRLTAIMGIIQRGVVVLAGLFALAVLLIIGNTIRLAIQNRHDEIEIAKLFGATDAFIRRPFLYNGMWLGLLGGLISWLLIDLSLWILDGPVRELSSLYHSEFSLATLSARTVVILLATGAALGWGGSILAVGRHLKAIEPH